MRLFAHIHGSPVPCIAVPPPGWPGVLSDQPISYLGLQTPLLTCPMLATLPPCSQPPVHPASGQHSATAVQPPSTPFSEASASAAPATSTSHLQLGDPSPGSQLGVCHHLGLLHLNPPLKRSSLTTALNCCFSRCVPLTKPVANPGFHPQSTPPFSVHLSA